MKKHFIALLCTIFLCGCGHADADTNSSDTTTETSPVLQSTAHVQSTDPTEAVSFSETASFAEPPTAEDTANKGAFTPISNTVQEPYILNTFSLDWNYMLGPVALADNSIVYMKFTFGDDNKDDAEYYKYDMEKDVTYHLGTIPNFFTSSGDIRRIGSRLFTYFNEYIPDSSDRNNLRNRLYQIDLEENTLTHIADDISYQTFVYIDSIGNNLLSYKGKIVGDIGISFLDVINTDNPVFCTFLSKTYDYTTDTGEIIHSFTQQDNIIYLLVAGITPKGRSWYIEKYNADGIYIETISFHEDMIDILEATFISRFEVFGNYAIIENANNGCVLFDISIDAAAPILKHSYDFRTALSPSFDDNISDIILYSYQTNEIWRLNVLESTLYSLDLSIPIDTSASIFADGSGNMLIVFYDYAIYCAIDLIPTKGENLINQHCID